MGMRAALTRLLGIATVACALVATPAVASAETQVMPDGVKAEACVRKISEILDREVARRQWPVTFSVGVAMFRQPPRSMEEALCAADALMYQVKRTGKQGVLRADWPFETELPPTWLKGGSPFIFE